MRSRWRVAFLGVTALAIVMELFASFDGNPDTDPWTDLIVAYVPGEVTALAIGGLSAWLAVHFGLRYWRRGRADARDLPEPDFGTSPIGSQVPDAARESSASEDAT